MDPLQFYDQGEAFLNTSSTSPYNPVVAAEFKIVPMNLLVDGGCYYGYCTNGDHTAIWNAKREQFNILPDNELRSHIADPGRPETFFIPFYHAVGTEHGHKT